MNNKVQYVQSGIGVTGLLFLVLITLKLTGLSDIGWFWVFSPLWLPTALLITLSTVLILCVLLGFLVFWAVSKSGKCFYHRFWA